ncbi:hypothetical protein [Streptomyces sp. NPDC051310]|uniref:hypothetical protein n=1 Tax=Streptomyces sp. NPDC051310 TaxID=3365649 RepID=UPI0037A96539
MLWPTALVVGAGSVLAGRLAWRTVSANLDTDLPAPMEILRLVDMLCSPDGTQPVPVKKV